MTSVLRTTLVYSLVPVVFTIVGAAAGTCAPSLTRLRGHVLHLAAGVVFSVVAVELLPEIQRRGLVVDVVLGFALGIGTMLLADTLLDRIRAQSDKEKRRHGDRSPHGGRGGHPVAPATSSLAGPVSITLFVAVGIDVLLEACYSGSASRRARVSASCSRSPKQPNS